MNHYQRPSGQSIMAEIDLAFLSRQIERVLEGQSQIRDDVTVVMARLDRIDTMIRGDRDEPRAALTEMARRMSTSRAQLDRRLRVELD